MNKYKVRQKLSRTVRNGSLLTNDNSKIAGSEAQSVEAEWNTLNGGM